MRLVGALLLAAAACEGSQASTSARSVISPAGGLAPDAVHTVVHEHVPAIRACYERFAKAEGRPMGVIRFGWQVDSSGAVSSVELVASSLHSAAIASCIAEEVGRWQFPRSRQATEIREYPFEF